MIRDFSKALTDSKDLFDAVPKQLHKETVLYLTQLYNAFVELGLYTVPRRWQWLASFYMVRRSRVHLTAGYDSDSNELVFIMSGSKYDLQTIATNADYICSVLQHHLSIQNERIHITNRLFNGHYKV